MIPGWPAMGEAPLDQNIKATGWEKVHDNCFSVWFDLKIPTSDLYTLRFPLWEESSKRAVERFGKLHEIDCRGEKRTFDRWVYPKQKDMITEFAELHGIEVLIRLEPCVLVKTEDDAVLFYLAFA